jgi:hypothetical protein
MPSPRLNASKHRLALIHAMRAEINRARYLAVLELDPSKDEVLRWLTAARKALDTAPLKFYDKGELKKYPA